MTDARGLYLCYFGLQEPLVQTQVLPYLRELTARGVRVSLLTFEADQARRWTGASLAAWRDRLRRDGIDWHTLPYHKRPSLPATLYDIAAGARCASAIARRERIDVFHARSHVAAVMGALAKRRTRASLVFDIRGFLAEEYVDSGNWRAGGPLYRLAKIAERWLCRSADGFVVLTERARETLFPDGAGGRPVEVIPCCVSEDRFLAASARGRDTLRTELSLTGRLVFVYAGSLGGFYLTRETAGLLAAAREADPRTYALILTHGPAASLADALERHGFSRDDYRVTEAAPEDVPAWLCAADVGVALVRPSYARRAMSPTKIAEYLAAGLPVIATAGVGDLDAHLGASRTGVLLRTFDREACVDAIRDVERLRRDPELAARCRQLARTHYDLHSVGGERYFRLYDAVVRRRRTRRLRVLALASYPVEAASSRYRLAQFIEPLAERGIDVVFSPFLDAPLFAALYEPRRFLLRLPRVAVRTIGRLGAALRAARADAVFVQREAMLFGPPIVEWIAVRLLARPLILDLDDATYVAYASPVYGRLATLLKWPGKTDTLIRWSRLVTCGNPTVAAYARARGAEAVVVPPAVDAHTFQPAESPGRTPTIGWIGTHSTYSFFERLLPVFERLAREVRFRLTVVGSGRREVRVPGVEVDTRPWRMEQEADDFRSLDIGVYPLPATEWAAGKSGLKAVQYMMSGVASIISPVGVCATLGVAGETHLTAESDEAWLEALRRLATHDDLRRRIGRAGRAFAERHYSIDRQADALAAIIRSVAR